jgi:O-antigen/teichoic acid export membrane protein
MAWIKDSPAWMESPPTVVRDADSRGRDGHRPRSTLGGAGAPHGPGRHKAVARSVEADESLRARQEAGLEALIGLATTYGNTYGWIGIAEAATVVIPRLPPRPRPGTRDTSPARRAPDPERAQEEYQPLGRLGSLLHGWRTDHLVRNSLYLMLSTGIQAALGFTFWIVMARLFSASDVGRASSLISATLLIGYFALFGLNSTLVRYLPTARDSGTLITAAMLLVAGAGAVIGLGYVLLTPVIAPRISFVDRPALAVGFVLLAAGAAVNLMTDSVFIARRKAGFCTLTDGAIGGVSKILFGVLLAGSGAYGLYCASVAGFALSALASVALLAFVLRWRPSLRQPVTALRPLLRFSGANYAANAFNLLPSVVVPIIVLDRLGAQAAAYYFVAFQMASLLYAAISAVDQAFLAEGSQAAADWRAIRRRSRRLAVILFLPGGAVLAVGSHWILLAFGAGYSQHGTTSLELLAAAVIPIAACNWAWAVLRLSGRLRALVISSAVYAAGICGVAWIVAPHGLTLLSGAWFAGASFAAIIASAAAARGRRKARHRRTVNSRASVATTP